MTTTIYHINAIVRTSDTSDTRWRVIDRKQHANGDIAYRVRSFGHEVVRTWLPAAAIVSAEHNPRADWVVAHESDPVAGDVVWAGGEAAITVGRIDATTILVATEQDFATARIEEIRWRVPAVPTPQPQPTRPRIARVLGSVLGVG